MVTLLPGPSCIAGDSRASMSLADFCLAVRVERAVERALIAKLLNGHSMGLFKDLAMLTHSTFIFFY